MRRTAAGTGSGRPSGVVAVTVAATPPDGVGVPDCVPVAPADHGAQPRSERDHRSQPERGQYPGCQSGAHGAER